MTQGAPDWTNQSIRYREAIAVDNIQAAGTFAGVSVFGNAGETTCWTGIAITSTVRKVFQCAYFPTVTPSANVTGLYKWKFYLNATKIAEIDITYSNDGAAHLLSFYATCSTFAIGSSIVPKLTLTPPDATRAETWAGTASTGYGATNNFYIATVISLGKSASPNDCGNTLTDIEIDTLSGQEIEAIGVQTQSTAANTANAVTILASDDSSSIGAVANSSAASTFTTFANLTSFLIIPPVYTSKLYLKSVVTGSTSSIRLLLAGVIEESGVTISQGAA